MTEKKPTIVELKQQLDNIEKMMFAYALILGAAIGVTIGLLCR